MNLDEPLARTISPGRPPAHALRLREMMAARQQPRRGPVPSGDSFPGVPIDAMEPLRADVGRDRALCRFNTSLDDQEAFNCIAAAVPPDAEPFDWTVIPIFQPGEHGYVGVKWQSTKAPA
jgi:hypothetical protein